MYSPYVFSRKQPNYDLTSRFCVKDSILVGYTQRLLYTILSTTQNINLSSLEISPYHISTADLPPPIVIACPACFCGIIWGMVTSRKKTQSQNHPNPQSSPLGDAARSDTCAALRSLQCGEDRGGMAHTAVNQEAWGGRQLQMARFITAYYFEQ